MNLITLLAIVVAVVSLVEWQLCRISVMTFVWYLTEKGFPLPSDADMKKGSRYVVAHLFKDLHSGKHLSPLR